MWACRNTHTRQGPSPLVKKGKSPRFLGNPHLVHLRIAGRGEVLLGDATFAATRGEPPCHREPTSIVKSNFVTLIHIRLQPTHQYLVATGPIGSWKDKQFKCTSTRENVCLSGRLNPNMTFTYVRIIGGSSFATSGSKAKLYPLAETASVNSLTWVSCAVSVTYTIEPPEWSLTSSMISDNLD